MNASPNRNRSDWESMEWASLGFLRVPVLIQRFREPFKFRNKETETLRETRGEVDWCVLLPIDEKKLINKRLIKK